MNKKARRIFLILVLVQALHSIEEYIGKLWATFPPAKFLCSLVSDNPVTGFLIINIGLFLFGLWCWLFPLRKNYFIARYLIGFWIALELVNGIGHPVWSIMQQASTPGIWTAPVLLIISIILFGKLWTESDTQRHK